MTGRPAIVRNINGQQTDKKRKRITKVFKDFGFDIEIHTDLKEVDFLDITFKLNTGL